MARKKVRGSRRIGKRGSFRGRVRRYARKANPMLKLMGAALYGAGRARIALAIRPYTEKIPAGNIADELGMMGVAWAAKKFLGRKVPIIAAAANAGMMIEAAQIGQAIGSGQLGIGNSSNGSAAGGKVVIG
jgi:hypothetical protein